MTEVITASRRRGCLLGVRFRHQGCVFDSESDVREDTTCGASYLPFADQGPAQTRVRNFSLPSYCNRLALRFEDHVALVRGNEDQNRNPSVLKDLPLVLENRDLPPVPKDLAVDEPLCRKFLSPFTYLGPDNQLRQIPPIVLTEGHDDLTHVSPLREKLRARPLGIFPPSTSELHDFITRFRTADVSRNINDFLCRLPERETATRSSMSGAPARQQSRERYYKKQNRY